jgi:hypothetical protein
MALTIIVTIAAIIILSYLCGAMGAMLNDIMWLLR